MMSEAPIHVEGDVHTKPAKAEPTVTPEQAREAVGFMVEAMRIGHSCSAEIVLRFINERAAGVDLPVEPPSIEGEITAVYASPPGLWINTGWDQLPPFKAGQRVRIVLAAAGVVGLDTTALVKKADDLGMDLS
jgi:hypothetical protein